MRSSVGVIVVASCLLLAHSGARGQQPTIFDEGFQPRSSAQKPIRPTPSTATSAPITLRKPVPTPAALESVRLVLEEVYARDLADVSPEGRVHLAKKLIAVAEDARDDPVDRFALTRRAAALFASAGNAEMMIKAVVTLAGEYQVEVFATVKELISDGLADKTAPVWEVQNLIGAALAAAEVAAPSDPLASEALLKLAKEGRASRALAADVVAQLNAHEQKILAELVQSRTILNAQAALAHNPNDAASATILGRYLCFVQDRWNEGLAWLAKSDDGAPRAVAIKELMNPTTPSAQAALADEWWARGEKLDGISRDNVRRHASRWYARAEGGLTGLRRELARKRMEEGTGSTGALSVAPAETLGARRIVFVCDATGTMLGLKFKLLQRQLIRAMGNLSREQSFNVIFFQGGDNEAEWRRPFSTKLEAADDATKEKARVFLEDHSVQGKGTNPLPALRMAFQQKPELVFFLTDGEFNNVVGYEQVLAEVRKLNGQKQVRVNTIAFISDDPKAEAVLRSMALEHDGTFTRVSERDLE
jgi:hypothetical protein